MLGTDRDSVAAFAHVALFSELSKRQLGKLARSAKQITHKPGAEVAAQGRNGLAFHVILDGEAVVEINNMVRQTLGAGDYFGEISMIDGQPRAATVRAGEKGLRTYALNRSQFLALTEDEPAIAHAIMVGLCARIRAANSAV